MDIYYIRLSIAFADTVGSFSNNVARVNDCSETKCDINFTKPVMNEVVQYANRAYYLVSNGTRDWR